MTVYELNHVEPEGDPVVPFIPCRRFQQQLPSYSSKYSDQFRCRCLLRKSSSDISPKQYLALAQLVRTAIPTKSVPNPLLEPLQFFPPRSFTQSDTSEDFHRPYGAIYSLRVVSTLFLRLLHWRPYFCFSYLWVAQSPVQLSSLLLLIVQP